MLRLPRLPPEARGAVSRIWSTQRVQEQARGLLRHGSLESEEALCLTRDCIIRRCSIGPPPEAKEPADIGFMDRLVPDGAADRPRGERADNRGRR